MDSWGKVVVMDGVWLLAESGGILSLEQQVLVGGGFDGRSRYHGCYYLGLLDEEGRRQLAPGCDRSIVPHLGQKKGR